MRFSEPPIKALWDDGCFYVQTIMRPLINCLDESFSKYNFQDAYRELDHYINHTLIEQVEHLQKTNDSLKSIELLKDTLIALHPMIPFLTEWLWSQAFPRYPLLGVDKIYRLHSQKRMTVQVISE